MRVVKKEAAFGQDIIDPMVAGGWKLGDSDNEVGSPAFRRKRRRV